MKKCSRFSLVNDVAKMRTKAMMNAEELAELLTIKEYRARQIIREINNALLADGYHVMNTRPPQAPTNRVMEYLEKMGIKETV